MQDLLLIRHATTHLAGTLCGQLDPPLNEEGTKQAQNLALLLQGAPIRRLYASDLQRSIQTALYLGKVWRIPTHSRPDLREISFGDWEGRRWSDVRAANAELSAMESSPEFSAPGGEAFSAFRSRVLRAFQEILTDSGGQDTAIVAHLGVIRVIMSELFPAHPLWNPQQRMDYCTVFHIRRGPGCLDLLTAGAPANTTAFLQTESAQK